MREVWKIHDFQASKVVPFPHAVFCGMVLHRYKNANSFLNKQSIQYLVNMIRGLGVVF